MKKTLLRNFALTAMLIGGVPHLSAQATSETVTVTEPGTLSALVDNLPSTRIESLTVKGALNATDIAYLRTGAGKLTKTVSLDISEITLVPGEESYGSLLVEKSDVGFGTTTQHYYISDEYHIEREWKDTGLGGTKVDEYVYCNDLSGAFSECISYKSVILPENLTSIGSYMFYSNTSIEHVGLPVGATAVGEKTFYQCEKLKSVELPDGVTKIPQETFSGSGLESISFSEHLDSIGEEAFRGCNLASVNLANVKFVGPGAFLYNKLKGELNLSGLDTIHASAFGQNETDEILDVVFSDKLKTIENHAFTWCNIVNLKLPEGLERIGEYAFHMCTGLTEVKIPASLVVIGEDAFFGTPWEQNIQSENGVVYIGSIAYSFDNSTCPYQPTLSFREGTVSIGSNVIPYHPYESYREIITKIVLPSTVQYICRGAFADLPNLEEINLPEDLKEISDDAFYKDKNLWIDHFPKSLESIGSNAFAECVSIPEVTLPENLKYLGSSAFRDCMGIYKLTINSTNLITDGEAFFRCGNLKKLIVGSNVEVLNKTGATHITNVEFVNIENSKLRVIGDQCFNGYSSLTIDALPRSLRRIGNGAFSRVKMHDFDYPNIEYIGAWAFEECPGINKVVISGKDVVVDGIVGGEFFGCPDLTEVVLGANIIMDGEPSNFYRGFAGIFESCQNLSKVTIGKSVTDIPHYIFCRCDQLSDVMFEERPIDNSAPLTIGSCSFLLCNISGTILLPDGTEKIGTSAFASNHISEIILPSTCRELGNSSFNGNWLTSVKLNDELITIGDETFRDNSSLKSINIPASCDSIGNMAFWGCNSLETVNMYPVNTPRFGEEFCSAQNLVVYVPAESLKAYQEVPALERHTVRPFIIDAESITIDRQELELVPGETTTLNATVLPDNTTDKTVIWATSDAAVATVDENGTVTAAAVGEAAITATCGNVSASCKVTVSPVSAEAVQLNMNEIELTIGETATLTATVLPDKTTDKTVKWTTSDAAVATVDENGTVTATAVGEAAITATCGNVSASCKVTVSPVSAEAVQLNMNEIELTIGETATLTATVLPDKTTDKTVKWTTSDAAVATVDENGTVTAAAAGKATITATCGNASAYCSVTVMEISGISSINANDITVATGYGTISITGVSDNERVTVLRTDGSIAYEGTQKTIDRLAPGYYFVIIGNITLKTIVR